MSDEKFFERLRADAGALRYEPDGAAMTRIRARIRERIARPSVASLLANWFRPLVATLAAVAAVAVVTMTTIDTSDEGSLGDETVEIVMAGDSYSVGP